jgi:hypothetical protein
MNLRQKHRWNKLKQRLSNIIVPGLDISFISSPVHKKTYYSRITLRFFQVKLDGEIIWKFPKDSEQPKEFFLYDYDFYGHSEMEYPITSINKYLDLPKDQLLSYKDKAGLADVLKVCDKRIGYNRLKNLNLSPTAKKIFEVRFKENIDKNLYKEQDSVATIEESFFPDCSGSDFEKKQTNENK